MNESIIAKSELVCAHSKGGQTRTFCVADCGFPRTINLSGTLDYLTVVDKLVHEKSKEQAYSYSGVLS